MDIQNNALHPSPASGEADGEKDQKLRKPSSDKTGDQLGETANNLLKQKINNFLITYFNHFALVLALIILAAGLFFFIYPQYQKIVAENTETEKRLQLELDTDQVYLNTIGDLKNAYKLVSAADKEKVIGMMPVGNQAVSLIPEIESIVLRNGAILDSIKIAQAAEENSKAKSKIVAPEKSESSSGALGQPPRGADSIKLEVNISAVNYPTLKNLLKTLENNLWLLDVAQVDYDTKESKAALIIYSYYFSNLPEISQSKNDQEFNSALFANEKFKSLEANKMISTIDTGLGKRDIFKPN